MELTSRRRKVPRPPTLLRQHTHPTMIRNGSTGLVRLDVPVDLEAVVAPAYLRAVVLPLETSQSRASRRVETKTIDESRCNAPSAVDGPVGSVAVALGGELRDALVADPQDDPGIAGGQAGDGQAVDGFEGRLFGIALGLGGDLSLAAGVLGNCGDLTDGEIHVQADPRGDLRDGRVRQVLGHHDGLSQALA